MSDFADDTEERDIADAAVHRVFPWVCEQNENGYPQVMRDFSFAFALTSNMLGRLCRACSGGNYRIQVINNRNSRSSIRLIHTED